MGHDLKTRITGVPNILSRNKYAEIKAPGWVCDASRLQTELGFTCQTTLAQGVPKALSWYSSEGWI
jgi:nucleoside-diphosphate-sugar epimerase